MPTISVHIDEADWEAIKFYAAQEQMTPEQFIQNALRSRLGGVYSDAADLMHAPLPEHLAALPRGSVQRVLTTLEWLNQKIPLNEPPLSREAIDAYLQAERDSWDNQVEE